MAGIKQAWHFPQEQQVLRDDTMFMLGSMCLVEVCMEVVDGILIRYKNLILKSTITEFDLLIQAPL